MKNPVKTESRALFGSVTAAGEIRGALQLGGSGRTHAFGDGLTVRLRVLQEIAVIAYTFPHDNTIVSSTERHPRLLSPGNGGSPAY